MQGDAPDFNAFADMLGDTFDLLHRLAETPQDSEWHAEGNVRIHTEMVLEETYKLLDKDAVNIEPERRLALILSALFHDIAKPLTTRIREFDGRYRTISPGHEDRGRSYLANKLMELRLPYEMTQNILSLVGCHHLHKRLVIKDSQERKYRKLARLTDIELLCYLGQADMLGRTCRDKQIQIEYIDLFRLFAEEYGVWKVSDPYRHWLDFFEAELAGFDEDTRDLVFGNAIRDAEAGKIFTPEEALAKSYQYRDSFPRLVVMCGPSGAGKSSWIHKNIPDYEIVSLDDLRERITGKKENQSKNGQVIQAAREELKNHLRHHRKVVWDATNLRRNYRNMVISFGFDYHALVTLVVFHLSESELFVRNVQRESPVSNEVLHRQLEILEWPDASEAHRLLFIGAEGQCLNFEGGCAKRRFPFPLS